MRLDVEDLVVDLAGHRIVEELSLRVGRRELVGLVGPNGSGKSTLLRALYRALAPAAGRVRLDGDDVHQLPPRDLARHMAVLLQERPGDLDFTVTETVLLGRAPHKSTWGRTNAEDHRMVAEALHQVGCTALADRRFATLSGGEKQRVLLARTLVQQPDTLVLDEPTNHLDVRHQLELLALVRALDVTVVVALHDLNLAASVCDRIAVLDRGRLRAVGPPEDVLTPRTVWEVFGVHADVVRNPTSGALQLLYSHPPTAGEGSPSRLPTASGANGG